MKVKTKEGVRLAPRSKFTLLQNEFFELEKSRNPNDDNNCSWNLLRKGQAVELDAKNLLEQDGLVIPDGFSVASFVEKELGVEVTKASKKEEEIVKSSSEEPVQVPDVSENFEEEKEQQEEKETEEVN